MRLSTRVIVPLGIVGAMATAAAVAAQSAADTAIVGSGRSGVPVPYNLPALKLSGAFPVQAGNRLFHVQLSVGREGLKSDAAAIRLIDDNGMAHSPIGVGVEAGAPSGAPMPPDAIEKIVPLAAVARGMTHTVKSSSGQSSFSNPTGQAVVIDIQPGGHVAFRWELSRDVAPAAIRLPGGRTLPCTLSEC
jgi:hypothetical protein